ncbi:hypothetical protein [Streptomyces aureus]|uniref:hypothetical protein n=1 Tax=Streptomyces aureus TaxID=193461 RepID=UPI0006E31C07|nr:hypothetical protein [Streptomyces aureus]
MSWERCSKAAAGLFGTAVGTAVVYAGGAGRATVSGAFRTAVGASVRSTVRASVGTAVRTSVGASVGTAVRTSVGTAVGSAVRSAVRTPVVDAGCADSATVRRTFLLVRVLLGVRHVSSWE